MYEYKIISDNKYMDDLERDINELAKEGREVVNIAYSKDTEWVALLKRSK